MFTFFRFDVIRIDVNWFEYKIKIYIPQLSKQFSPNSDKINQDKNLQIP